MSDHEDISNIDIDLLINSRKKAPSHDAISIFSSGSGKSNRHAVGQGGQVGGGFRYEADDDAGEFKEKARDEWMSRADDDASSEASSRRYSSRRKQQKEVSRDKKPVENEKLTDEYWTRRPRNEADAANMKRELLYEFDRLWKKGHRLPRTYTMDSSLEEMQSEYIRLKRDREMDAGIMFQRQMLMTCVSGIEFLSTNFSPFDCKLDGWSHHVSDKIDTYDDIFEELYVKYRGSAKMAPELRLLMALGGSAVMFSMQNRMASMAEKFMNGGGFGSGSGGGGGGGGIFAGLGNMFGNMFSQAQGQGQPPQQHEAKQHPTQAATPMRGPTLNVESVIRNLQHNAFENRDTDMNRVEIISTVSENDIPDDDSVISGAFMRKKGTRRTLDLSDV